MRPLSCALGLALLGLGCTSSIYRVGLGPPAQARPALPELYVQAREAGFLHGSSAYRRSDDGRGFTLDVHNRGKHPITLRLSQSVFRLDRIDGPQQVSIKALTSGAGDLPAFVYNSRHGPLDITIPPGAQQTMWLLFKGVAELEAVGQDDFYYRSSIVVPLSTGSEVVIKVQDPRESPGYEPWPTTTGISFLATGSVFGERRMTTFGPFGFGLWHIRDPVMFRLAFEPLTVLETVDEQSTRDDVVALSLSATYVPRGWFFGIQGGGGALLGEVSKTSWNSRGTLFTWHLGLAVVAGWINGVPFTWRAGYIHTFDVPVAGNGSYLGLELPFL